MAIVIDGTTAFESEVSDTMLPLPSDGDLVALLPEVLRPQAGKPPTPLTRITVLTMLIDSMRQFLEAIEALPILQPITITFTPHGVGKVTFSIDMPMPDDYGQDAAG